ncbi:hypothetical protein GOP47_0015199 [Adiantum capillus-veneris]|uniref:Uncharacterized protein n=1 Tax=Adiantum capillus-veneris TaxID=13818 RepID=A0A9D4ZFH1_ADICA|nr:hypothetical protein GOP47_0015199 [Adiantum capillus-veneris]
MKTLQIAEGPEDGDLSQQRVSTWAVMVSLPRLNLPRSSYGGIGTFHQEEAAEAEEREPSACSFSQSSLSEDEVSYSTLANIRAEVMIVNANLSEVGASINAPGASMTDCSLSDSASSSSCETPKGPTFEIPEPLTPPSPPRKRRALSGNRATSRRRGTTSTFFRPADDDFELLLCPLASHVM